MSKGIWVLVITVVLVINASVSAQEIPGAATAEAYGAIYQTLVRQANLLAYIDNFRRLAFMCLLCMPAALLFKKVRARGQAPVMH